MDIPKSRQKGSKQEHLLGSFQDPLWTFEGLATLVRIDKGGLLPAKFNWLHWYPTLTLGEWSPSATSEGPGSCPGGQALGYPSDGGQLQLFQ